MSTNFPTTLDDASSIPVEAGTTPLATNHVVAHQNIQDALEAVEAKVGVNSSAVTTTHDYKLSLITGSNKAVSNNGATIATPTITGATITTSTVNGVTITTAGSATDFLAANGTYQAGGVANASVTVKGIVEAATSAEVTAGTATGGTGAVLAVTPDALAASTPVFNGSGLTNISTGFLTSGAPATTTTNTSATVLTYALAGGTLGTNKAIRVRITAQIAITASNAAGTYTLQYGGTSIGTFGYLGNSGTPTVTALISMDIIMMGSGATNTQRFNISNNYGITSGTGGAIANVQVQTGTAAIDSTTSQNLTISCTSGSSGVVCTLVDYLVQKIV